MIKRSRAYILRGYVDWDGGRRYHLTPSHTPDPPGTDQGEMEGIAANLYATLFTSQNQTELEVILPFVPRKVTDDMNTLLCVPFRNGEVSKALFMTGPSKAPGVDGFNANFYQRHWELSEAGYYCCSSWFSQWRTNAKKKSE